jgi:hypothetical protein
MSGVPRGPHASALARFSARGLGRARGGGERARPAGRPRGDGRAVREEGLEGRRVAAPGRDGERRPPLGAGARGVGSVLEEERRAAQPARREGAAERGLAARRRLCRSAAR